MARCRWYSLFLSVFFILHAHIADAKTAGQTPLSSSRQVLAVVSDTWESISGELQLYERDSLTSPWQAAGPRIPVSLGRTGMAWGRGVHDAQPSTAAEKQEGDGKAPAGVFKISTAFGYAQADAPQQFPFLKISPDMECVDDVLSTKYNAIVDGMTQPKDWKSSEIMLRPDGLYALGAVVDHNTDPMVAEKGSCIFLHIWRGPGKPTAGCTAMEEQNLRYLLNRLVQERNPLLVQLPRGEYQKLKQGWELP